MGGRCEAPSDDPRTGPPGGAGGASPEGVAVR